MFDNFERSLKGASFADEAHVGVASERNSVSGALGPRVGFRCARPAAD
jgi:hypothetical protein